MPVQRHYDGMLLEISSPLAPTQHRGEQLAARRELLLLLATATGLLVVATLLGRTPLGLTGSPSHRASWTDGPPGLGALRMLRIVLLIGSITFITWLGVLTAMCVPRRTTASTQLARLPFGRLVRQALIGTVTLGLVGSCGGAAIAESRPAVVADDATGGQRWPDLPQQQPTATSSRHVTKPAKAADSAIVRTLAILPELAVPTTAAPPATADSPTTKSSALAPAGPSLVDAFEVRISESRSSNNADNARPVHHMTSSTRIVRPGESFWSIAEDEVLTTVDEATDADIADYWRRLIEHNRARLPDPTNPDLLWVGAILSLPDRSPNLPGPNTAK